MRDQEEHADTEGDEEAWEQYYDVTTFAGWYPVNRGRRARAGNEKSVL